MDQMVNILLAVDKAHTSLEMSWPADQAKVYEPNHSTLSEKSICDTHDDIFIRCTIKNQFDVLQPQILSKIDPQGGYSHTWAW